MHRTIATALALLGIFVFAVADNYDQLSHLLLPVGVATFTGEVSGTAFQLNGTIQVGHFCIKFFFIFEND